MNEEKQKDRWAKATGNLRERRKAMGLVRLEVWVPEEERARVVKYVNKVRRERGIEL